MCSFNKYLWRCYYVPEIMPDNNSEHFYSVLTHLLIILSASDISGDVARGFCPWGSLCWKCFPLTCLHSSLPCRSGLWGALSKHRIWNNEFHHPLSADPALFPFRTYKTPGTILPTPLLSVFLTVMEASLKQGFCLSCWPPFHIASPW